jgi:hypothetical protein
MFIVQHCIKFLQQLLRGFTFLLAVRIFLATNAIAIIERGSNVSGLLSQPSYRLTVVCLHPPVGVSYILHRKRTVSRRPVFDAMPFETLKVIPDSRANVGQSDILLIPGSPSLQSLHTMNRLRSG